MDAYTIIMLILAMATLITSGILLVRGRMLFSIVALLGFIGLVYLLFNPELIQ